jgi:alkanesulfonate monooxygenase SsuD/methylene tetrahydromethanopterin reductase-like flavin-dependent oxidoreductase (luciferase family)
MRRIAKMDDGWMMVAHAKGADAEAAFAELRSYVEKDGRDPERVGIEVWISTGEGGPAVRRKEFLYWRGASVTFHNHLGGSYSE